MEDKKKIRLKNGTEQHKLTYEERVKGAMHSHKTRTQKKLLRQLANELLETRATKSVEKTLQNLGIEDNTNGMAVMVGQLKEALKGNTRAAEFLRDTAGQKPKEEIETNAPVQLVIERRKNGKPED